MAVDRTSSERRTFRLGDTVNETITALRPNLRQAGHEVTVTCPGDLVVDGYPGVVSQVLTNFVMNSLTHGFDPGQRGHLHIAATEDADGTIRLSYADDGKIWEYATSSIVLHHRRGSGSGLGLHIVFNLVTGPLGGTVQLDPAVERGAGFVLTFPKRAPDK